MSHSPFSAEQVLAVARLARLEVAPEEMTDLQTRLGAVLHYAESLADLDLTHVMPLTRIGDATNRFRPDEPGLMMSPDEGLRLAPDQYGQYFKVPKVLGDGGGA